MESERTRITIQQSAVRVTQSGSNTATPNARYLISSAPRATAPTPPPAPTQPPAESAPVTPPVTAPKQADFAGLAATQPGSPASPQIFGRVILRGTPPPEKPLPLDSNCGKLNANAALTTRFYVTSADAGLADVFIHITSGIEGRSYANVPVPAPLIDQRGCQFYPQVIGVVAGTPLIVRNSDPLLHNVHFTPTVEGNGELNQAHLPRGPDKQFVWNQPEVFLRLKCDVHPWMFAYIGVESHPFFAVSDANGEFRIATLPPPGRYVIEAYHRKAGKVTQPIEVRAGEPLRVDFELRVPDGN
ncbi:MAG: carboxypeptidase regulatory-like domain-containing protein [Verrucomicrobia bacterium]|nr:carboxypeptidase regulatory-like domain-containing protein [Verrucomicrobiota bacterium]